MIKNLNIKKTCISLLLTGAIALSHGGIANAKASGFNDYDYVKSTAQVNIRLENSINSSKLGFIKEGDVAFRILTCDNNWVLVNYNGTIGYVSGDYLEDYHKYNDNIEHHQVRDYVELTSNVNFRSEPSLEGGKIGGIKEGSVLEVIAKTNNNWYLVSYDGRIGYVSGDYAISMLDKINSMYPGLNLSEFKVQKVAYASTGLNIREGNSTNYEKIGSLRKNETFDVLGEYNGWYLIMNGDNLIGFVDKQYTRELKGVYVLIDISDQKLYLYDDNHVLLSTDVTTGKDTSPTNLGMFEIYSKDRSRYLVGDGYRSYVEYWMPFDGGIGLHDASWRSKFGGSIYHKNGSHGCVNIPKELADDIYNKVEVGTKVVVQK